MARRVIILGSTERYSSDNSRAQDPQPSHLQWHHSKELSLGRELRFWLLQIWGWTPFFALQMIIVDSDTWLSSGNLTYSSLLTVLAVVGSLLLRRQYRQILTRAYSGLRILGTVLLLSLLLAIVADVLFHGLLYLLSLSVISLQHLYGQQPFFASAPFIFINYLFWSAFYLLITRQEQLKRVFNQQQQVELNLVQSQLRNLEAQLQPHFIFNTINNIRALVLLDPEQAREMLACFADTMRYQINYEDSDLVTVQSELQFVRDYIALVKLQLGERLQMTEQIDTGLLTQKIPRMAIQLLVENAVKHGSRQSEAVIQLSLSIAATSSGWSIIVSNLGAIPAADEPKGIGLANLQQRLQHYFHQQAQHKLYQQGEFVVSRIDFSLLPEESIK